MLIKLKFYLLQGNHIEQSDHVRGTTQGNMKCDNITKINHSPLFSFGDHSKNFPAQAVKYNSPTLATIIESKPSNDSSPSGSKIPPELPKTSPPSSELLTVPSTSTRLQYNTDPTLNSTVDPSDAVLSVFDRLPPTCCYPHYLQSVARPCCTEPPLPDQRRPDVQTNLRQTESYTTGILPDPQRPHIRNFLSFLNSQIHETPESPEINLPPSQSTSAPLKHLSNHTYSKSVELAGNIQTPETTQLFSQEQKEELLEDSQTAQFSQMVNDSQSINEPEVPQSTSAASVNDFELSAPSSSGYGDSSLFPLGTSRLQHYRGYNISPNEIYSNASDLIDRRRYCTHCHLCTLDCECSSSDDNGKIYMFFPRLM